MNAHAILSAQGWRGKGHSLHATDDSIGLAKPLLLSRKQNTHGLGNQHFTSDQWWLNAFDEQVKGLDTSQEGKVVQTVTAGKLNTVGKGVGRYALYSSFVRGGLLEGSIPRGESAESSPVESPEKSPARDSDGAMLDRTAATRSEETTEERRARREAKRLRKAARLARKIAKDALPEPSPLKADTGDGNAGETKEERRARKEAKRKKREAKKLKQDA